jgi:hypothetical protein
VESVEAYLESLPPKRREAVEAVRAAVNANLPPGYEEGMQYGGIGWYVPHSICPDGYHCDASQPVPMAGLVNGKAKISLHLFGAYVVPEVKERLVADWKATGKKLDMGASCVRFTRADAVPLHVVGEAIAALPLDVFLTRYEASLPEKVRKKRGRG